MIRVHSEWFGVTEYPECTGWYVDTETHYLTVKKNGESMAVYRPGAWSRVEDGAVRAEGAKSA